MTPEQLATAAAWAVPIVVLAALTLFLKRRRAVAGAFGDPQLLARLLGTDLRKTPWPVVLSVAFAGAALGMAIYLAAPRDDAAGRLSGGGPVILVLDASNSMMARDLEPSRLDAQRRAASRLLEADADAEFGLVVFAGRAYTLVPPTRDRGALDMYLEALDPGMVSQTGSSVAAAIRQGISLIVAAPDAGAGGTLVLITDGDAPGEEADVAEAVRIARRAGVVVHTVGAASPGGGPVPLPTALEEVGAEFMTSPGGAEIVSRLGEPLLMEVASGSGGVYVRLREADAIEAVARRLEIANPGSSSGGERSAAYAWMAGLALLLLSLQAGLAARGGDR